MLSRCYQLFALLLFLTATSPAPLRVAAEHAGLLVGTAVRPSLLSKAAYSATLAREFNMVEPEDAMKWWMVRSTHGPFDFSKADEIVRFAQAHGMKVRGHCLVWDHNNPQWLADGHFTPAQLSRLLQEHIITVMKALRWTSFRLGCSQRSFGRERPAEGFSMVQSTRHRPRGKRYRLYRTGFPLGT
jgi:endo-1,4-beta-xylanase